MPRSNTFCCITTNDTTGTVRYCEPTTNAQCVEDGTTFDAVNFTNTTNYAACRAEYDACSEDDDTTRECLSNKGFDSDNDTVSNICDLCHGADDRVDVNNNGYPDACECGALRSHDPYPCAPSQTADASHPACNATCSVQFFACCTSGTGCTPGGQSTNATADKQVCNSAAPIYGDTQDDANQACVGTLDQCKVCSGNNSTCLDCAGTPTGTATYDVCGVCNGNGTSCECLPILTCPPTPSGLKSADDGKCRKSENATCQINTWTIQIYNSSDTGYSTTFASADNTIATTAPIANASSATVQFDNQDSTFQFPAGTPYAFFVMRATTEIFFSAGNYTFGYTVDDGARLKIDGAVVLSDERRGGALNHSVAITFNRDAFHTFDLLFVQFDGQALIKLMMFSDPTSGGAPLSTGNESLCMLPSNTPSGTVVCQNTDSVPCGSGAAGSVCRCDSCACQYTDTASNATDYLLCVDCAGVVGGSSAYDVCDVCGGNGTACDDCKGVPNGSSKYDACDVCAGDGSTCQDCHGVSNGPLVYDQCGVCGGDGKSCLDCTNMVRGTSRYDKCDVCNGDGTTCLDCAGKPFGNARYDSCDVCQGDDTSCLVCETHACAPANGAAFTLVTPNCTEIAGTCQNIVGASGGTSRCSRPTLDGNNNMITVPCIADITTDPCQQGVQFDCKCDQPCGCAYQGATGGSPQLSFVTSCVHVPEPCVTQCPTAPTNIPGVTVTQRTGTNCTTGQFGTCQDSSWVVQTFSSQPETDIKQAYADWRTNPASNSLGAPVSGFSVVRFANSMGQTTADHSASFIGAPDFPNTALRHDNFVMTANATIFFVGGDYVFSIIVDDSAQVYVDGQLVVHRDGNGNAQLVSGAAPVTTGYHSVFLFYYQSTGPAQIAVYACPSTNTSVDVVTGCQTLLASNAFQCALPTPDGGNGVCTQNQAFSSCTAANEPCGCDLCACAYDVKTSNDTLLAFLPCNDCTGVNNGPSTLDACDVCAVGANGTSCLDCKGVPNGPSTYDACDVCAGNGTSCLDCNSTPFGTLSYDACDVCGGNGHSCLDCFGAVNGAGTYDVCDICGGDGQSCRDCAGTPFGTLKYDDCDVCGGDLSSCMTCSAQSCPSPDQIAPIDNMSVSIGSGNCTEVLGKCSRGVCRRSARTAIRGDSIVDTALPCRANSSSVCLTADSTNACDCDVQCACQYKDSAEGSLFTSPCQNIGGCAVPRACPDTSTLSNLGTGNLINVTAFDTIGCRSGVAGLCVNSTANVGTTECVLPSPVAESGFAVCNTDPVTPCVAGSPCVCNNCQCKFTDNTAVTLGTGATVVFLQCVDCKGTPGGSATYDACGVCGGDGSTCKDCKGIVHGTLAYDQCDVCGGDGSSCAVCGCEAGTVPVLQGDFTNSQEPPTFAYRNTQAGASGEFISNPTTGDLAYIDAYGSVVPVGVTAFELSFTAMFAFNDNNSTSVSVNDLDQIVGFFANNGGAATTYYDFNLAYAEFNNNGFLYTFDDQNAMQIYQIPAGVVNPGVMNNYRLVVQANCIQFYVNGVLVQSIYQHYVVAGTFGLGFAASDYKANNVGLTVANVTVSLCACPANCPVLPTTSPFAHVAPRGCMQGDVGTCAVNAWNVSTFNLQTSPSCQGCSLQQAIDATNAATPIIGSPLPSRVINFWNGYNDTTGNDHYQMRFMSNGAVAFPNQPSTPDYFSITANLTLFYAVPTTQVFALIVDDHAQLRLDGNVVVQRDALAYASMTPPSAPIAISAGYHTFDLFYYQNTLPAEIEVLVSNDNGTTYVDLGPSSGTTICQLTAADGTQKLCSQTASNCTAGSPCTCDQCECQYTTTSSLGATVTAYEPCLCGNGMLDKGEQCDGALLAPGVEAQCCDKTTCMIFVPFNGVAQNCDDKNFCTMSDTCSSAGQCVGVGDPCAASTAVPCFHVVCNSTTSNCDPVANGNTNESCNSPNPCLVNAHCDVDGNCVGTQKPCAGQCDTGDCDVSSGSCVHKPIGTPCDEDGLTCAADICDATGQCVINLASACCETKTCPFPTGITTAECSPRVGTCASIDNNVTFTCSLVQLTSSDVSSCTPADTMCTVGAECRCATDCACQSTVGGEISGAICTQPTSSGCTKFCPVVSGQNSTTCLNNRAGTCDAASHCVLTNATDPTTNITCSTQSCGSATSGTCRCDGVQDTATVGTCFCQKIDALTGAQIGFLACIDPVCGDGVLQGNETCEVGVLGATAECCQNCTSQVSTTGCDAATFDPNCGSSMCNSTGGCDVSLKPKDTGCPSPQQCNLARCNATGRCVVVHPSADGTHCTSDNDNTCDSSKCQSGVCTTTRIDAPCCTNEACPFSTLATTLICGQVSGICSGADCLVNGVPCANSTGTACTVDHHHDGESCMCDECGCFGFNSTLGNNQYAPCTFVDRCPPGKCGVCTTCDPSTGVCMFDANNNAGCNDGIDCTTDVCTDQPSIACDNLPDDTLCVSSDPCEYGGMCTAQSTGTGCMFMTLNCAPTFCFPNNTCVKNSMGVSSCTASDATTVRSCDDGDICTADSCNTATNNCTNTAIEGCGVATCQATCPFGSNPSVDQCKTARVGDCSNGWLVQAYDLSGTNKTVAALQTKAANTSNAEFTEYVGKINYGSGVTTPTNEHSAQGYFDNDRPFPSAEKPPRVTTNLGFVATRTIFLPAGEYEFRATHDDTAVLIIDSMSSAPCINATLFTSAADTFCTATFAVDGSHQFTLFYTNNAGDGSIELAYRALNSSALPPVHGLPDFRLLGDSLQCLLTNNDDPGSTLCSINDGGGGDDDDGTEITCSSGPSVNDAGQCLCDACTCSIEINGVFVYDVCLPQDCTGLADGTQCDDLVDCTLDSACFSGFCIGFAPDDSLCPLSDDPCTVARCAVVEGLGFEYQCVTEAVPGCKETSCGQCAPVEGFVADTNGCRLGHVGTLTQAVGTNDYFCSLLQVNTTDQFLRCSLRPVHVFRPDNACTCDACTCEYTSVANSSVVGYSADCTCANRECMTSTAFPVVHNNCSFHNLNNAGSCLNQVCQQFVLSPNSQTQCGEFTSTVCSSSNDLQCAGAGTDGAACYCDDCTCTIAASSGCAAQGEFGLAPCIALSCVGEPNGTPCDDHVGCTTASVCENNVCVGLAPSDLLCANTDMNNTCTTPRCVATMAGVYMCAQVTTPGCTVPTPPPACAETPICPVPVNNTLTSPCALRKGVCDAQNECRVIVSNDFGSGSVSCGACNFTSSPTCQCDVCTCKYEQPANSHRGPLPNTARCQGISNCTGAADGTFCDDQVACTKSSACFNGVCVGLAPSDEECQTAANSYAPDGCTIERCAPINNAGNYGCIAEVIPGCVPVTQAPPPPPAPPGNCTAVCSSISNVQCVFRSGLLFNVSFDNLNLTTSATLDDINAALASYGVFVSSPTTSSLSSSGIGAPILFNSTVPTAGDFELGTPNAACCATGTRSLAEGSGYGGHRGRPGENCIPKGLCLAISDDGNRARPHAAVHGGAIAFDFCTPAFVQSEIFINAGAGTTVQFFDQYGVECPRVFRVPALGTNGKYVAEDANGDHQFESDSEGLGIDQTNSGQHFYPDISNQWAIAHCDAEPVSRLVVTTKGPLCLDDLAYQLSTLGTSECTADCGAGDCCATSTNAVDKCVTSSTDCSGGRYYPQPTSTGSCSNVDQTKAAQNCNATAVCCPANDRNSVATTSPSSPDECNRLGRSPSAVINGTCPPIGACCLAQASLRCIDAISEVECAAQPDATWFANRYCRDPELDQCRRGQCCSVNGGTDACLCSEKTPDIHGNCNGVATDCSTCRCKCQPSGGTDCSSCPAGDTPVCGCTGGGKRQPVFAPATSICSSNVIRSTCEDADPYAVFTPYETNDESTANACLARQPCLQGCTSAESTICQVSALSKHVGSSGEQVIEYFFSGTGCSAIQGLLFDSTTVFTNGSTSVVKRKDLSCGFLGPGISQEAIGNGDSSSSSSSSSSRRRQRSSSSDSSDNLDLASSDVCGVCDDKCRLDSIYVPVDATDFLGVAVHVPRGYTVVVANVTLVSNAATACATECTLQLPVPLRLAPRNVTGCGTAKCDGDTVGSLDNVLPAPTPPVFMDTLMDGIGFPPPCGITGATVTAQDPLPLLGVVDELRSALVQCDPQAFVKNTPVTTTFPLTPNGLQCNTSSCTAQLTLAGPTLGLDTNTQSGLLTFIEIQLASARSDIGSGASSSSYQLACCALYELQSVIRSDALCGELQTENCNAADFVTPQQRRKRDLLLNEDAALVNGGAFTIAFEECDEVDEEFVPDLDNNDLVLSAYATVATNKSSGAWLSTTLNVIPIAAGTLHDHALEMRFDDAGVPPGAHVHIVRYGVGTTQECYTVNSLAAETTECPSVNTLRLIMSTDAALPQKIGVDSPFVNTVASIGVSTARHMTTVHITMPAGYAGRPSLAMAFELRQRTTQCVVQTHAFAARAKVRGFAVIVPGNYLYPQEGVPAYFNASVTPPGVGICVAGDNAGMRCAEVQECPTGYCITDDKTNIDNNWHCMNYPAPGVNRQTSCSRVSQCPHGRCYGVVAGERGAYPTLATFLESAGAKARDWSAKRVTQNAAQIYYDPTLHGGATAAAFKTAFKKN